MKTAPRISAIILGAMVPPYPSTHVHRHTYTNIRTYEHGLPTRSRGVVLCVCVGLGSAPLPPVAWYWVCGFGPAPGPPNCGDTFVSHPLSVTGDLSTPKMARPPLVHLSSAKCKHPHHPPPHTPHQPTSTSTLEVVVSAMYINYHHDGEDRI